MPSPFDITTVSNTVTLDNNRAGVASFTAKNTIRRRFRATAKLAISLADERQPITTVPPDAPKWLTIVPPPAGTTDTAESRDFAIDGTQNYQINIVVPPTAPAASYKLKLTLADEANPDDNFTDSPEVLFTVREIPKPPPAKFPIWIIAAIIIAILVIVVIVVVAVTSNNAAHVSQTETAEALTEEATQRALGTQGVINATGTQSALNALGTQNAVGTQSALDALGTQNAVGTQNAAIALQTQNAVGTQTALNIYVGSWVRVNTTTQPVTQMTITSTGNNLLTIAYTIPRQPLPPATPCLRSSGSIQILCPIIAFPFFTPSPFQSGTIPGVTFNGSEISGSDSAIVLRISPLGNGQLNVNSRLQFVGSVSDQTFRK